MGELRQFLKEEDAVGVVEIILILVVLIGLVIIFKDQITSLVKKYSGKDYQSEQYSLSRNKPAAEGGKRE